MPTERYKVWSWGEPVGRGVLGACHIGVYGVAKSGTADQPFIVTNEVICANLARILALPVPPGFVVNRGTTPYFASLNFNLAGEDLPPVDPTAVVGEHPDLACGIVVFDAWILNEDRHVRNIHFDADSSAVMIFDHSHAFLTAGTRSEACTRLDQSSDDLCIGVHCLGQVIKDTGPVTRWVQRIREVPRYYIEETVRSCTSVGLPLDMVETSVDFLLSRRDRLMDIFRKHQAALPLAVHSPIP